MTDRKFYLSCILIILFFAFAVNNNILEANIMESRNLTTAREMLEKGNWLQPTMNGELRLEKPPFPTWITAAAMAVFGQDNMALLRLPAVLAGVLLVFFLFRLTRELSEDKHLPFLAAGTGATSFYILFLARDISWDIFCHSFMLGAIWLIHRAFGKKDSGWHDYIGAGILMGLSFLSKGPVAFFSLLFPYLIARLFVFGWKGFAGRRAKVFTMIVIALSVSIWWSLLTYLTNPEHSLIVARQESAAWINRNVRPFYHYLSFPAESGIWALIAAISLVFPYAKKKIDPLVNYRFVTIWVWSAILLLSLFPEKKERYLLPVLIPLAILCASYFKYLITAYQKGNQTKADNILLWINSVILSLVSVFIPVALLVLSKGKKEPSKVTLILITFVFLAFAFHFIRSALAKKPFPVWGGMVGLMLAACLLLFPAVPKIMRTNPDYRSYTELRERKEIKGLPFFFNGEVPGKFIEVVWGSGREIRAWDPKIDTKLPARPPLVLISHQNPKELLPIEILERYDVEIIGHFDTNPATDKTLVILSNYVSIIKPKGY